ARRRSRRARRSRADGRRVENHDVWDGLATRLEGKLVALEPLVPEHGPGLFAAGADPEVWRWMPVRATASAAAFEDWLWDAIERTRRGLDVAVATLARE